MLTPLIEKVLRRTQMFLISKMSTNKFSVRILMCKLKLEKLQGHKVEPVILHNFGLVRWKPFWKSFYEHLLHLFYKLNETQGNRNLFLSKYFIEPIGYYGQNNIGSKLKKLWGSPRIRKKILESIFVYIVFLKPRFTVLKEKKKNW